MTRMLTSRRSRRFLPPRSSARSRLTLGDWRLIPAISHSLFSWLVLNGSAKRTTIGKLAAQFSANGHSVLLAAAIRFAPQRSNN